MAVASSRTRQSGRMAMTPAMATRCFWPPERLWGARSPELVNARHLHGVINPAANLLRRNTQILGCEGHILLHDGGDDLVIRVLEHHTHRPADIVNLVIVCGVHAFHVDLAGLRQQNGVEMLGQCAFSATVGTQHGHEFAALYFR